MRTVQLLYGGILFLLIPAAACAQPAELSEEIKLEHRMLVREYLEASRASAESRLEAAEKGQAATVRIRTGSASLEKVSYELESSMRRLRHLPLREQVEEILKMYDIAMGSFTSAVQEMGVWLQLAVSQKQALGAAEKKHLAAAKLLDFQTELIGVLTDHQIGTKFADLEPK